MALDFSGSQSAEESVCRTGTKCRRATKKQQSTRSVHVMALLETGKKREIRTPMSLID
jgi:hypothetical protein